MLRRWCCPALLLAITACSTAPRPVAVQPQPCAQVGTASWYRPNPHHGAAGAFSAAHRTLPFGARVRVTDLESGRSVTVQIDDRGPFVHGRIIDLSPAAAREIGMQQDGLASVRVEVADQTIADSGCPLRTATGT